MSIEINYFSEFTLVTFNMAIPYFLIFKFVTVSSLVGRYFY